LDFEILKFSQFLSKIQIIAYFYIHMQNFVKINSQHIAYFWFSKRRPSAILDFI